MWDLQEQCYFFILLATKTVIRTMIRNYEELVVKLTTIFIVEGTFSKESSINVKTIALHQLVSCSDIECVHEPAVYTVLLHTLYLLTLGACAVGLR